MAPDQWVIYDCIEEQFELSSPLLNELWVFVGFLPEVRFREIRHIILRLT